VIETSGSYTDDVYTGAISFAIKGTLLQKDAVETLAECRSLEELVNRLKATPYSDAISKVQPPHSARRLELALRERLADVHMQLSRSSPGYELLENYYLKNIAWNLKSALKSKALNKSYEEATLYIDLHAEELVGRRELIVKVLSAKDIQEASAALVDSEFGEDVVKAASTFVKEGEVRAFDLFVDHSFYQTIARSFSERLGREPGGASLESARSIVALDIDTYNTISLLRAKLWGLSSAETNSLLVTPTFGIPFATLQKIAFAESVGEAFSFLSVTRYGIPLPSGAIDEEMINRLEERFNDLSYETAKRSFLWNSFQVGSTLALVKLMEFEVRNLAAIAFGVEAGIPSKNVLLGLKL
jgi:V/A-type H+-transporting ATPase subunit C